MYLLTALQKVSFCFKLDVPVKHLTCQIQDSSPICFFQLQVCTFYTQVLNEEQRQRLCQNFAGSLKGAQLFIQKRMASSHTISTPVIYTVFTFLSDALHMCLLLQGDESNSYKHCGLGFWDSFCRCCACIRSFFLSLLVCYVWICIRVITIHPTCSIIVFWFVQVENLKAIHPDYASRVQKFLDKFNEEAEKVRHAPTMYFVTVSLYFTCVISSFFVHFRPFQNASVRVYTRTGASAMTASSKMWWNKNPTNGSLASEHKQMHLFPNATNNFNMNINLPALLNWTSLILSFFYLLFDVMVLISSSQ